MKSFSRRSDWRSRDSGRALLSAVLVASVGVVLVSPPPAAACSCIEISARESVGQSEFVFIGKVVGHRENPVEYDHDDEDAVYSPIIWTFEVLERIKGEPVERVEIGSGYGSSDCGADFGSRSGPIGIVTYGSEGERTAGICGGVWTPDELRDVRDNPATPWGVGPIEVIVAGRIGEARLVGLNSRGEPVIHGFGSGHAHDLALCPGQDRFLEFVGWPAPQILTRDTASFAIVGSTELPDRDHSWNGLEGFTCLAENGVSWSGAFTTWQNDQRAGGELIVARGDVVDALEIGTSRSVAIHVASDSGFVLGGVSGTEIRELDLTTGEVRQILDLDIASGWEIAIEGDSIAVLGTAMDPQNGGVAEPTRSSQQR